MTQDLFNRAVAALQAGDAAQTEQLCLLLLKADARNFDALHLLGLSRFQLGRLAAAMEAMQAALAVQSGFAPAWCNFGMMQATAGRPAEALVSFERALSLAPPSAEVLTNAANALHSLGRSQEAFTRVELALSLNPALVEALICRANIYRQQGRAAEALADCDRALKVSHADPVALNNRALALSLLGRHGEALDSIERSLALRPGASSTHGNRAGILLAMTRHDEALAAADRALALEPHNAEALCHRGAALRRLGRSGEGLAAFRKRGDEAMACFDRALALKPHFPQALEDRATLRAERREHAAAIADLQRLLALEPQRDLAEGDLLSLKLKTGDWQGFDAALARLENGIAAGRLAARPMVLQSVCADPAILLAGAKTYAARLYPPLAAQAPSPRQADRLRIGYLAAEWRAHPTAYLTAGVFEHHDRAAFEVVAIDNGGGDDSPMRARLEAAFDSIIDISRMSDAAAAKAIATAGIDILVDLNGYAGDGRMGVLAQRPAPLAVTWLGYPGTTGNAAIDYILADPLVIPPGEENFYSEAVVRLPFSYQPNDAARPALLPVRRADHGLPEDAFVFCNFNQGYKLTPSVFAAWMRILAAVPESLLWLWEDNALLSAVLRREAAAGGIAPERLVFAPALPMAEHVSRMALADLFLDGWPYNAHTTASDALWAGLPLLTRRGTAFAGRVAASVLTAAGLPELVAEDDAAYERRAIALAGEGTELAGIRARLEQTLATSALFDTARFTRHLEAAYRGMWDARMAGARAHGFDVPA